jgi:hypothetical protein
MGFITGFWCHVVALQWSVDPRTPCQNADAANGGFPADACPSLRNMTRPRMSVRVAG